MIGFVTESLWLLLYFDIVMRLRPFKSLYDRVRYTEVKRSIHTTGPERADICHAMDKACVLYFKRVMCLQRSAATAVLLRRHGWSAQMVLGARTVPFESHAWCEIEGTVVNDKPYVLEIYQELVRC